MYAGHLIFLFLAIGVVAFLYSSVGHAGASGYIAAMTLFGLSTATIRPTALVLNILVALIASFQFWRAGHFSWKLFWPFALLSIPAAYFGGYLQLPARILKTIILRRPIVFSSRRSPSRRSPTLARRTRSWFRHRVSLRSDRDRRRNFSYTSFTFFQLGENETGIGGFCVVYFGEFNRGPGRFGQCQTIHSGVGIYSFRRRNHWRCDWFAFRKP